MFGDGDGFAGELETIEVEGLGHQGGLTQEEQISGRIRGLEVGVKKKLGLLGIERTQEDRVGVAIKRGEGVSGQRNGRREVSEI